MRPWWFLVLASLYGLAHAEPQRDAQAHLEQGKHLYEIQDYDGAIAEYQAGYLVEQRAEFLYGIGQAYRMKGDCERAARSYKMVIAAPDGGPLADAARKNMDRCHVAPEPRPPSPPPVPPPLPVPQISSEPTPWYRDALGDALVIGGVTFVAGGAISWKVGHDEANRTYGTTSYEAWLASYHQAGHADTLQRIGIAAIAVGGAAVIAGVIHYVWPGHGQPEATGIALSF